MAAMEEQLLEEDDWSVQLQVGEEIALIPWEYEPFVVTHVFLVDPESAAGQGAVADACVKTTCVKKGTRNIMLAQLSSEMTEVELEPPLVLDEEFCFYVTRPGGGDFHADTNADKDAVVVQFKGFVLYPDEESDTDEGSEEEEEGDDETASSKDDDDGADEEYGEDEEDSLALQLQIGEEVELSPWDDEPFVVTHVFLVDPESAAGQGVVATAGVKMGTRNIMLAQLSSEVTDVKLETPVLLDEECCFYVMRPRGDTNTDIDKDAVVVQFNGFVLYPAESEEEKEEEEGDEEAVSSKDDDSDGSSEDSEKEDEGSDSEVDRDVARDVGGLELEHS